MKAKNFRKFITDWRLEKYSMKMDLPSPMSKTAIDTLTRKLDIPVTKSFLDYTIEFGGTFNSRYADVPDSLIPGNFSSHHDLGEFYLLQWRELLSEHKMLSDVSSMGDFDDLEAISDQDVESTWFSPKWLPFASNGGGDYLCLDLAPTKTGKKGQIICFIHDSPERPKLADSIAEFFDRLADSYKCGRIYLTDEDYDLRKKKFSDYPTFQLNKLKVKKNLKKT